MVLQLLRHCHRIAVQQVRLDYLAKGHADPGAALVQQFVEQRDIAQLIGEILCTRHEHRCTGALVLGGTSKSRSY